MSKLGIAEIYDNSSHLRDKVTYGTDGVDDDMLARAEAAIAALHDDYLTWAAQDIERIERLCTEAMALPEQERGHALRELFVAVHGMKGQGGSFGYPLITAIADSFSRFVEGRGGWGHREMEVITVHIAAIQMVIGEHLAGDGGAAGEQLLNGLHQVLEKFGRY
jgi:hypothetical protein